MKALLIFFLSFYFCPVIAQKQDQELIDSLDAELPTLKDDSNKAKVLNRIAQIYERLNPMKSFAYAEKGLALSEKLHWKRGIANFNNNLGLYICDTGNSVLARVYFEKSYALNKEMGIKFQQANNLINIGRSYQFESDFTRSIEYFFKALAIAQEMKNNDQVAAIALNLSSGYFTQQNYPKVTEYAEMALKFGTLANNPHHTSKAFQHLAGVRHMAKDTAGSKMYLEKALKICEESNNRIAMADVLLNLSLEYADYNKAIEIMLRVNKIMSEINPNSEISLANMGNLGNAYNQLAKQSPPREKEIYLKKAQMYLSQAKSLAEQNSSPEYLAHMSSMLSDLEEHKGNYKAALDYYKQSATINDSLFSQGKKNQIAGLEGKHNIALKDSEIAINKLMLANQRKTLWGLIAGLTLFGVIVALLYWQSRSRKKTNTTLMVMNNQLDEANKIKARFFGILSHDLRSPIVNLVHFLHLQKDNPDLMTETQQTVHRQKISDSAEDLLNTMETMLLWSKEQMENFRPNIKNIAIGDLFEYIQKFFGQTDNVTISFEQDPGLVVSTDENYLRTIMQNLTSNAIKALKNTPNGTIIWQAKKENDKTILSIKDNGPGIEAELVKTLFDERVVNNAKTGLGLHLVRDLAKAINYKIAVKSENSKGTTFTLSSMAA